MPSLALNFSNFTLTRAGSPQDWPYYEEVSYNHIIYHMVSKWNNFFWRKIGDLPYTLRAFSLSGLNFHWKGPTLEFHPFHSNVT